MPIYLPQPEPDPRGPDGKGWNRLNVGAHFIAGIAQCALKPRSYPTLLDSYNTVHARWGGYEPCIKQDQACGTCPVHSELRESTEQVPFNAPRVLIRVETEIIGEMFTAEPYDRLWMTDQPDDPDYRSNGQRWTYPRLRRLRGWKLGRQYRDKIGPGFWMHRTPYVAAPHVEIRHRERTWATRHAFFVAGTRAALLTCYERCRHGDGLMLNVIGHHVPDTVDDGALQRGLRWRLPQERVHGRHVALAPRYGPARGVDLFTGEVLVSHLSFSGPQWTAEQIHGAAAALLAHTEEGRIRGS